jgi:hypothetical protein
MGLLPRAVVAEVPAGIVLLLAETPVVAGDITVVDRWTENCRLFSLR